MSVLLATEHTLLSEEEETQEKFPYHAIIRQFEEKLPENQVSAYLVDPIPESYTGQLTGKETETLKEPGKPPVIPLRTAPVIRDKFLSLQKWEGIVLEVKEDSFLARLIDLTEEGPEEEVELPLEEVSEDDRKLVKPGAIFYWNIGYHDTSRGQRIRSSMIRFRRLPVWQKAEIDDTKRKAKRLRDAIGWK